MRVLKFGGSSLSTPEKIKKVAQRLADIHKEGESLIVVVSAMGASTDELQRLAHAVSPQPAAREMDMLMSAGERISMALLCMALNDLNCPAISFTGSQAGILTDSSHQGAQIVDIRPIRVDVALEKNQVVVLAGFQGVDPNTKEITTLGRGGSDTTAVAMAAHYGAQCCEMYKDVNGIFSDDPNENDGSELIPEMSWEELLVICKRGAQVIHERAALMAREKNMPLAIGNSESFQIGTYVKG